MKQKHAEWLLAFLIIAQSTSFLFNVLSLESLSPFNLLGVRFLMAFGVLAVISFRRLLKVKPITIFHGAIIGAFYFTSISLELHALHYTDTSTAALLENSAVVFVPMAEAVLARKLPGKRIMISSLITLAGVAFLTVGRSGSFSLGRGEILCLLCAAVYSSAIMTTCRITQGDDALMIGVFQVGFIGLYAMIASFLTEAPRLPSNGREWAIIVALALVCSCVGFTLQPYAQSRTTPERASMFCPLSPLAAAVLGAIFLQERLGFMGIIGGVLILTGMVLRNERKKPAVENLQK